jgi:anti-anti-sigma factor
VQEAATTIATIELLQAVNAPGRTLVIPVLVPPFDIDIRRVDGVHRVAVSGELDLASSPVLAARLAALVAAEPGPIDVDLAAVSFIDARGLGVLVAAHARCNDAGGPGLRLVGASRPARRLFELVGMAGLLESGPASGIRAPD